MKKIALFIILLVCTTIYAQNPIVPGYFADPSVIHVNGKYYIYSTTDGYQPYGTRGKTFAWVSDNLIDWEAQTLRGLPEKTIWAPACIQGKDGRFYLYCQNAIDFMGYVWVADTPTGEFKKAACIGGFDIEPFLDPVSGKIYVVSASKELLEMDNDVKSPTYLTRVVNRIQLQGDFFDFTEGPYMLYDNGFYYLMWSGGKCWQNSYNVNYATSRSLFGPYSDGVNNPILKTDEKNRLFGPGHNSVLRVGDKMLMFYHRQDAEFAPTCNFRFPCVAEVKLENGEMKVVKLIDNMSSWLNKDSKYKNLALSKKAFASSEDKSHRAYWAIDDCFDTSWSAGESSMPGFLTVDLGKAESINRIEICFKYIDMWVTYNVEYSQDNKKWETLVEHRQALPGNDNMYIDKDFSARYVRLNLLNNEDRNASLWEFRILKRNK